VDQAIGGGHRCSEVVSGLYSQIRRECRRFRGIDVEHGELARTKPQCRVRDRRAGAARAELHHALEPCVGQAAPEALGEAPPVGVVAGQPAVADHHRVHCVERPRVFRQAVEQRNDRLLARIGDVQAGEAHALRRGEQLRERLDADTELVEIDELVEVAQALLVGFALVQGRRAR